jgi:hypothetical protein
MCPATHKEDGDAQEEGEEAAVHERHDVRHLRNLRRWAGRALKRQPRPARLRFGAPGPPGARRPHCASAPRAAGRRQRCAARQRLWIGKPGAGMEAARRCPRAAERATAHATASRPGPAVGGAHACCQRSAGVRRPRGRPNPAGPVLLLPPAASRPPAPPRATPQPPARTRRLHARRPSAAIGAARAQRARPVQAKPGPRQGASRRSLRTGNGSHSLGVHAQRGHGALGGRRGRRRLGGDARARARRQGAHAAEDRRAGQDGGHGWS